jgi:hypothetical protein
MQPQAAHARFQTAPGPPPDALAGVAASPAAPRPLLRGRSYSEFDADALREELAGQPPDALLRDIKTLYGDARPMMHIQRPPAPPSSPPDSGREWWRNVPGARLHARECARAPADSPCAAQTCCGFCCSRRRLR